MQDNLEYHPICLAQKDFGGRRIFRKGNYKGL